MFSYNKTCKDEKDLAVGSLFLSHGKKAAYSVLAFSATVLQGGKFIS